MTAEQPDPGRLEHHLESHVDPDHGAGGVDDHDPVGEGLDDRRLAAVHIEHRLLEASAVTGVPDGDHHAADRVVQMVGRHHVEVDCPTVGPHRLHLERDREPTARHQVVEEGAHVIDAGGIEEGEGVQPHHVACRNRTTARPPG